MTSHATPRFWRLFHGLPADIQRIAVKAFRLWQGNPNHPSLRYRRLEGRENFVTVRIGDHYRALSFLERELVEWIWIGPTPNTIACFAVDGDASPHRPPRQLERTAGLLGIEIPVYM